MQEIGRFLVVLGAVVVLAGLLLMVVPRVPWLGRLPGDIVVSRGPVTFYFPLMTCLLVSAILTLAGWLFTRR